MTVRAYITKYCLSTGITVAEGRVDGKTFIVNEFGLGSPEYYGPKDWHLKWEDALARAEHCRKDRLRSEQRRIKRFENMTFSKPELVQ